MNFFLLALLSLGSLILLSMTFHLRINTTRSMPLGLYREITKSVERNDLVEVCLPKSIAKVGLQYGYLAGGRCFGAEPIIKKVVAMAGDSVYLTKSAMIINQIPLPNSQAFILDANGKRIPTINRQQTVTNKNSIWLLASHDKRSWDSRYYGPINIKNVVAVLTPLYVFN